MNISNKLTLLRVALVPVFLFFALSTWLPNNWLWAGLVYGAASVTDILDGKLARKYNLVTDFGKFLDPLADKVLVISALVALLGEGLIAPVALIIIISREFMVSGIRMLAASGDGSVIAANYWGKIKTLSQMITSVMAFIVLEARYLFTKYGWSVSMGAAGGEEAFFGAQSMPVLFFAIRCIFWAVAAYTALSGIVYLIQNKRHISMN